MTTATTTERPVSLSRTMVKGTHPSPSETRTPFIPSMPRGGMLS